LTAKTVSRQGHERPGGGDQRVQAIKVSSAVAADLKRRVRRHRSRPRCTDDPVR
jgi:hypothetical protein